MNPKRVLATILWTITIIFILRLAYLQILTDRYKLNGVNTSIKAEYIMPQRGFILDRNGEILVGNIPTNEITYNESLIPKNFDTIGFCNLLGIDKAEFNRRIAWIKKQPNYTKSQSFIFKKDLNREEIASIQEKLHRYPGFSILKRHERNYLVNNMGNILGYINEANNKYIKTDSTYYMPGDLVGMTGVEKSYEKILRGVKGVQYLQKSRTLKTIGSFKDGEFDQEVVSGQDITLTIDYPLQRLAEELLTNKRGAIVALDPNTGEILALASSPAIDPHYLTGKDKQKNLHYFINDSMNKPMYDRATQATYPPGSPFKLLTGLAALQMGVLNDSMRLTCQHGFRYGSHKINCHCGLGSNDLESAIQRSCNSYFSKTYLKILEKDPDDIEEGINEWNEILESFGLNNYFGNDIAAGSKGNIPNSEYYNKRLGEGKWTPYSIISNGIGQGEILLTPLQMANFTAAIANKGFYYTPHIVKAIDGQPIDNPEFTKPKYTKVDAKYFDPVIRGMEKVVLSGTGHRIRAKYFTQAGKTGTSQNPQGEDHSLFVLFAPVDKPKIVVVAVVENAGFGATYAAPMASVIAEKYLTDTVARPHYIKHLKSVSFKSRYQAQWVRYLRRIGKYEVPKPDSIQQRKLDSLQQIKLKKEKEEKEKKEKENKEKLKNNNTQGVLSDTVKRKN